MMDLMKRFWNDESGQGLTEYALVLALISIGLIAVLVLFRDAIGRVFDRIVEVDGVNATQRDCWDLTPLLSPVGREVTLVVRRGDERFKVQVPITRARYFVDSMRFARDANESR